ncbi:SDR family NAD(P)-dependent oxidoreductase [Virgibacillus sp. CBA3643]|uniref:SDR family NAD(P)-dependent oxidoreductase n=1 Tax=Virgibacillus sp. CBA3643 TaxID=2942278 RepID=UPI0035A29E28
MSKLNDKVAIVTGAAEGLGKEIAIKLAEEGAKVVTSDINEQLLTETSTNLKEDYEISHFVADVSDKKSVDELMKFVVEKYGKINILVNNAGGSLHTPKYLADISENDWDKVLNVNLKGTFLASQAAIQYMKKNQSGKIINLSSIGGRTASLVTGAPYAAAKGGVISLTRRLAMEVGEYGINVNAVAPGLIISGERMHNVFYKESTEEEQEKTLNDIPLRKLGEINDISNAVAYLSSDDSKYMTGAIMDINGGRFMG